MDSTENRSMKVCRICQEDETESEQVLHKPCKCNSHVHKECLLTWIKTKINSDIIDYQNDLQCEVCLSKIRYTHKTTLDNENQRFSSLKLLKDMTNFFFKRNMNVFKIILNVIFFVFVPIMLLFILFNILEGFLVAKRNKNLGFDIDVSEYPLTPNELYLANKVVTWINLDYFPTEKSLFLNTCGSEIIALLSFSPGIAYEFALPQNGNAFYKMYEYIYGSAKAKNELEAINNEMEDFSKMSKIKFVFYYFAAVFIGVPFIAILLISREVIPRYILGVNYNPHGNYNEMYYASYFTLVMSLVIYFAIKVRQYNNKPISYKTFIYQQFLKMVICLKTQEICIHGLSYVALKSLNITKYFVLNNMRSGMVLTMDPSMEAVAMVLQCLAFLRTNIFRNGSLYSFPTMTIYEHNSRTIKSIMLIPIPKLILENITSILFAVLAFFGIGGVGIIAAAYFKPELFPFIIACDRFELMVYKGAFVRIISSQTEVLKNAIYIPIFQQLGSWFRLSNYLFDYDRPFERGTILYHESVGTTEHDLKQARDTNPLLFKEPCVSEREAMHRLERGNPAVKAYLVQNGYNAKIPNASSIYGFSSDWFKPLNHAGHVIVKTEPEDENRIPEDIEEIEGSESMSLLECVFPDHETYDICFLPSHFTLRLYAYFFLVSLIQNALIFIGIVAGYKLGDMIFQFKEVRHFIMSVHSKIQSKNVLKFLNLKYRPVATYVLTKILVGSSALCALIKVATTQMRNTSTVVTGALKNLKRKISLSILSVVVIIYGCVMSIVLILSLTYVFKTGHLLWTSIKYDFTSLSPNPSLSFGFFIFGMFVDYAYFNLFAPLGIPSICYSFYIKHKLNTVLESDSTIPISQLWKLFFVNTVCSNLKVWFEFWGKPFMYQMTTLAAYCTIHSLRYNTELSLLKVRSVKDLNHSLLYMQLTLLLGGRRPLSILYKLIFFGYFVSNIVNWLYPILKAKWENWKLITLDNKLGETDVIILNDE